ncbi:MAG: amidohydrolase family protein [Actinomycetota bacterium]|nr:amidohydrolase family protein [Actinomycetota bacterium]
MRTLYRGGAVYAPEQPAATALLVVDDRVAWLGSDADAHRHVDAADNVVDLAGALVTPAFVDAHVHVTETGLAQTGVHLSDATSVADALARVERAARRTDGPVHGHGWDERLWPERRPPTRAELDRAAGGRPVYLSRVDVHSAAVSSALAERAGLADLAGWSDDGLVERDAHHAARAAHRGALTPTDREPLHAAALDAAAAAGIGCVHEMSAPHIVPPDDLGQLVRADHPVRVRPFRGAVVRDASELAEVVAELGLPPDVPFAGLAGDLCVDGSIGSRTAAMRDPYGDADTCGHTYLDAQQVRDHVVTCTRSGLPGGFHVIGDRALDVVLDGLLAAESVVGEAALRAAGHRLEHVELVDAEAIAVLARLGVTASMQPAFDAAWGGDSGMYAERLGVERARATNPLADLHRAGVPLLLGSDSPVTPMDPWASVTAALLHHKQSQRLPARVAVDASTGSAFTPGVPATFAVWSCDRLVDGLPDLAAGVSRPRCLRTVVAGRTAHDALV